MQTVRSTLILLICSTLLVACGLKGPLYLPEESPASSPATGQAPDTAIEDEEEKEDSNKKPSIPN